MFRPVPLIFVMLIIHFGGAWAADETNVSAPALETTVSPAPEVSVSQAPQAPVSPAPEVSVSQAPQASAPVTPAEITAPGPSPASVESKKTVEESSQTSPKADEKKEAKKDFKEDAAFLAIQKEMATKFQPEESLTVLPISLEKGSVIDFGMTPAAKVVSVAIKNSGKKPVTMGEASINGPFFIEKNDCRGELKAGAKCELGLKFDSKTRGFFTSTLSVGVSSPYQQDKWTLVVKGTWQAPPLLRLRGDAYFSEGVTGKRVERKFTLSNDGDVKAEGVEVALANPGNFSILKSECGSNLDGGKSCHVTVLFEAKADGVHQDAIKVAYTNGLGGKTAFENGISGVALKPAKLLLTVPEKGVLGMKMLGLKLEFDWLLSNVGDVAAEKIEDLSIIKTPFAYRKKGFPGEGGTCKKSLGPRESCRITATFSPLLQGDASLEFSYRYFDGKESQTISQTYTGTGLTPARIGVKETAPGALQPVLVTKRTDRRFHIVNEGQSDAKDLALQPNDFQRNFKIMTLLAAEEGELCAGKTTLKPSESCEFGISFTSEKGGDFEASVGIKYNDGLKTQVTKFPFKVRALATAKLAFEEKDGLSFGNVAPNASKTVLLKVTNDGEHRAEQFTLHGLGEGYSLKQKIDDNAGVAACGFDLDEGKTCAFPIEFNNSGGGKADREVKLTFFDGLRDASVTYKLKAVGLKTAKIELVAGDKLDFGDVFATSEVEKDIVVKNAGDLVAKDLVVKLVSDSEKTPFVVSANQCIETLETGKTCVLKVKYNPLDIGDAAAKLFFAYADELSGELKTEIPVQGRAKLPAKLAFDKDAIDLGNILSGVEVEKILLLKNDGAAQAQRLLFNFGGDPTGFQWKGGKFPGDGGDCGETIEVNASCKVVVTFKSENGSQPKALMILSYSDGVKSQRVEVAMGGNSVVPGKLAFNKETLDFGARSIGGKNVELMTINNSGGAEIDFLVDQFSLNGEITFAGGAFPGQGGDCTPKLAKGASCKIALEPKGSDEAAIDAKLTLFFKDLVTEKSELTLTVTGALKLPALIESEGESDFGSVFLGDEKTISLTLKNSGGTDADVKITSSDPQVRVDDGCTAVKGKDTCALNLTFKPTSSKPIDAKVNVKYANGIDQKELTISLKGAGTKLARISLGKTVLDFGTIPTAEKRNKLVTLKNEGDTEATQLELVGIKDDTIGFDGSFPGKTGNCTDTLKAGAECIIDIQYSPSAQGQSEHNLEVKYNNGKEDVKEPLMVRGLAEGPGDANRELASEPPK